MIRPSILFLLIMASQACESETESSASKEIHGDDDFIAVEADGANIDVRYRGLLPAIGRLMLGDEKMCTATHIGDGMVVTAGHCLVEDTSCSDYEVQWGVMAGWSPQGAHVSRCERTLSVVNDLDTGNDYWIFQVTSPPAAKILLSEPRAPTPGNWVSMFSHPHGQPLTWSGYCDVIGDVGSNSDLSASFIHNCDSQPGSSGAAVIERHNLTVVGIHSTAIGGATPFSTANIARFLPGVVAQVVVGGIDIRMVDQGSRYCFESLPSNLALPETLPAEFVQQLQANPSFASRLRQVGVEDGATFLQLLYAHRAYDGRLALRIKWQYPNSTRSESLKVSRCG